ncbi:MAG: histidine kinase, partial [Terracidiphilus sp.]
METSLLNRLQATLLGIATLSLFLLAVLNLRQESHFQQPDDGVWWREAAGGLVAEKVLPDMPGQRAGIQEHDLLTGVEVQPVSPGRRAGIQTHNILTGNKVQPENLPPRVGIQAPSLAGEVNYTPTTRLADLERALDRAGVYGEAYYVITRDGIPLDTPVAVYPEPSDRSLALGLRLIGLVYLAIGIYVLFRRWTAPRATHFYLFCLVSFALYALKYTGALSNNNWQGHLDWTVFWSNVLAESLQPALFLHFALSFPEERLKKLRRRWLLPLVYAPGAALLGLWLIAITRWQATGLLKHRLDQTGTAYDAVFYVLAAVLFLRSYSQA